MLYAIFPLVFKLFQNPLVRWTEILITRWAGPCSLLLDFWARWMAFGSFFPCLVYRRSPVLLGFGPLVDHWGVGFGPWWTEKIGLYI